MRAFRPSLVPLLLVALCRVALAADPGDAHALLRKGIELQREASWSASVTSLERARTSGTLSTAERAECAFYLGAAYLAIGSDAAARRELAAALELDPSFEPPQYTSPKVTSLLGEVAKSKQSGAQLESRPPRQVGTGDEQHLELPFEARRARPPIYGVVRFRMRGELVFSETPLATRTTSSEHEGTFGLVAEVTPERGGVLEYYADALAENGRLSAGSAARPFELPVAQPEQPPKKKATRKPTSKLVWLAIPAGVIVGAAVGVGVYFGLKR